MSKPIEVAIDLETLGLNPTEHMITCICATTSDEKHKFAQYVDPEVNTEKDLLLEFMDWLYAFGKPLKFITANGRMFDVPYLVVRSSLHNISESYSLKVLFNSEHADVDVDYTKKRISLNTLCEVLGVEQKTSSGLEAIKMWNDKKYTELRDYCFNDALITMKVYKRLEANKL